VPEHAKREAIKCGDHGRLGSSTGCARLVDLDIVCHRACHGSATRRSHCAIVTWEFRGSGWLCIAGKGNSGGCGEAGDSLLAPQSTLAVCAHTVIAERGGTGEASLARQGSSGVLGRWARPGFTGVSHLCTDVSASMGLTAIVSTIHPKILTIRMRDPQG